MLTNSSIAPPRMLRHRLPRVCVPVVGKNAAEMLEKAEQVARVMEFAERAAREATMEEERQAARDARYAARKARKRKDKLGPLHAHG